MDGVDIHRIRGIEAFTNGDYLYAIHEHSLAISQDPSNYVHFANRCSSYLQLFLYEEAEKDARQVIQLKPNWTKGYLRCGQALFGQNKLLQAKTTVTLGLNTCCSHGSDSVNQRQELDLFIEKCQRVKSLPDELLAEVFSYISEPLSWGHATNDVADLKDALLQFTRILEPLSRVCKWWYTIIQSCNHAWTKSTDRAIYLIKFSLAMNMTLPDARKYNGGFQQVRELVCSNEGSGNNNSRNTTNTSSSLMNISYGVNKEWDNLIETFTSEINYPQLIQHSYFLFEKERERQLLKQRRQTLGKRLDLLFPLLHIFYYVMGTVWFISVLLINTVSYLNGMYVSWYLSFGLLFVFLAAIGVGSNLKMYTLWLRLGPENTYLPPLLVIMVLCWTFVIATLISSVFFCFHTINQFASGYIFHRLISNGWNCVAPLILWTILASIAVSVAAGARAYHLAWTGSEGTADMRILIYGFLNMISALSAFLIFLILLAQKMNLKTGISWVLVYLPLDVVLITMLSFVFFTAITTRTQAGEMAMKRLLAFEAWYVLLALFFLCMHQFVMAVNAWRSFAMIPFIVGYLIIYPHVIYDIYVLNAYIVPTVEDKFLLYGFVAPQRQLEPN